MSIILIDIATINVEEKEPLGQVLKSLRSVGFEINVLWLDWPPEHQPKNPLQCLTAVGVTNAQPIKFAKPSDAKHYEAPNFLADFLQRFPDLTKVHYYCRASSPESAQAMSLNAMGGHCTRIDQENQLTHALTTLFEFLPEKKVERQASHSLPSTVTSTTTARSPSDSRPSAPTQLTASQSAQPVTVLQPPTLSHVIPSSTATNIPQLQPMQALPPIQMQPSQQLQRLSLDPAPLSPNSLQQQFAQMQYMQPQLPQPVVYAQQQPISPSTLSPSMQHTLAHYSNNPFDPSATLITSPLAQSSVQAFAQQSVLVPQQPVQLVQPIQQPPVPQLLPQQPIPQHYAPLVQPQQTGLPQLQPMMQTYTQTQIPQLPQQGQLVPQYPVFQPSTNPFVQSTMQPQLVIPQQIPSAANSIPLSIATQQIQPTTTTQIVCAQQQQLQDGFDAQQAKLNKKQCKLSKATHQFLGLHEYEGMSTSVAVGQSLLTIRVSFGDKIEEVVPLINNIIVAYELQPIWDRPHSIVVLTITDMSNIIKFIQCIDLDAREYAEALGPDFEFHMSLYHSELVGIDKDLEPFKQELTSYIKERQSLLENESDFFNWMVSESNLGSTKISAARKLLSHLSTTYNCKMKLTNAEVIALSSGKLGNLVKKYERWMPTKQALLEGD